MSENSRQRNILQNNLSTLLENIKGKIDKDRFTINNIIGTNVKV